MKSTPSSRAGFPATKTQKVYKEPFIQYFPSQAAELNDKKSKEHKVSGRFLSLLYQRLNFWSQYSKYIHNGKRFFFKSAEELSQELFASTKQIYRGLKALVELGLIERHKLNRHNWKHTYYYHLPHSIHTKDLPTPTTSRTTRTSSRSKCSSRAVGSSHTGRQNNSTTNPPYVSHIEPAAGPAGPQEAVEPIAGPCGPAGGSAAQGPTAGPCGGGLTTSQTSSGNRSSVIRTMGPHISTEEQSISNIQIRQIVERCNLIARYGIEVINRKGFALGCG
jgi:hypothetical protein